ncbi:hypothetical protein U0070_005269 [Myodes glareolus]|uniref:Uncharacterized protein n=1 Tax=Myodes glareolus TaxID=447135 RepID=A0AAW0H149_MYOGA
MSWNKHGEHKNYMTIPSKKYTFTVLSKSCFLL